MSVFYAFVRLKIGDLDITSDEDHLISMKNVRISDIISQSITFTLYDDSAILLEAELMAGENNIEFSYGYTNGRKSKVFKGTIVKYNLEFTGSGSALTIEAMSDSVIDATDPVARTYSGMRIDEIVAQLAAENSWSVGLIVECAPVLEDSSKPSSATNYKKFNRETESAQEFITNKLVPLAVSKEGKGDYIFRLDESESGPRCFFVPRGHDISEDKDDIYYTYVMGQENEKIISFVPNYNDVLVALLGSNAVVTESQDPYTNEYQSVFVGDSVSRAKAQVSIERRIAGSSYTFDQMRTMSVNVWSKAKNMSYPATLQVRGDVDVDPLQKIDIVVLTKDQMIHHSSGKYLIESVEDVIENGSFLTNMKLLKNADVAQSMVFGSDSSFDPLKSGFAFERNDGAKTVPTDIPTSSVLEACKKYLGIAYKAGGKTKQTGLDASGFSKIVMNDLGITLPDSAVAQAKVGTAVTFNSSMSNLKAGDLVFWTTTPSSSLMGDGSKILEIARKEVGYKGGSGYYSKYGAWYGIPYGHWCAMFISWCANEAGVLGDIVLRGSGCTTLCRQYSERGQVFKPANYTPVTGDQFLVAGSLGGYDCDHIGFVDTVSGDSFLSCEGNYSNSCAAVTRKIKGSDLYGYIHPNYPKSSGTISQTVGHVAIYVGKGYVAQSSKGTGSVNFAKITETDKKGIVGVRRVM